MKKRIKSYGFNIIIWLVAGITAGVLVLIIGFILLKGIPGINAEFLTKEPEMMGEKGGIFSILIGTLYVTLAAIIIATPIGVAAAVYFTEYSKEGKGIKIIRFFTEVLAGIPSIIFGLFGFAFFVVFAGMGWSVIAGGMTLAMMILPTVIRTCEESLNEVPVAYREASLALGASKLETIYKVVLPCCKQGILTGVLLGIGRAIGETACIMLTVGGSLNLAKSIFDPTRTMALHLYMLAAEGISEKNTYATAALLVIIILAINLIANRVASKEGGR